jgi:ABC-2 type transport system permease protein
MSTSVVRHLILKDLYLTRWMMLASILSGLGAIAIMPVSNVSSYVGSVSLMCVLIVLNIFLVMNGVVQERKDKVLLFVLSLPVSTTQYIAAKVAANAIAFVVPWLVLTVTTVVVIHVSELPDGIVPMWVAIFAYLLAYYCALLGVGLVGDSMGWHATAITIGNISLNFLIPILLSLPSVSNHRTSATAVWTADVIGITVAEIVFGAAALGLGIFVYSRRADFV